MDVNRREVDMREQTNLDPVDRILKECHLGEQKANLIYHMIAEERQQHICLDDNTEIDLDDVQVGEFVQRFSSEVTPEYWVSKLRY
jgi:hypothetical protein